MAAGMHREIEIYLKDPIQINKTRRRAGVKEGKNMTLKEVQPGQQARVDKVGGDGQLRQHFLDMGVIPGVTVTVTKLAPMGDPMEIRLHGYELTLRLDDADKIEITQLKAETNDSCVKEEQRKGVDHPGLGEEGKFHPKGSGNPLPEAKKRKTSANTNRKCNVAEVTMIRLEILQGNSIASIAKRRGLAQETVRKIRDRESYQDIPWPEKQAEYPIIHDMKRLADIMLQGPMPEKEDGFAYTEGDIQALTGEKIDPILIRKYGIYPTYHARIVYLMMQRALDGDHTMLFALFSLSSYDNLVPQLIDETQAAEKES